MNHFPVPADLSLIGLVQISVVGEVRYGSADTCEEPLWYVFLDIARGEESGRAGPEECKDDLFLVLGLALTGVQRLPFFQVRIMVASRSHALPSFMAL